MLDLQFNPANFVRDSLGIIAIGWKSAEYIAIRICVAQFAAWLKKLWLSFAVID